jgi:hypothetical protein
MKPLLLIIFSLILGFPGVSSAELYKFYDKNGNLSFTDDASRVPEEQRESAETIREVQSKPLSPIMPATEDASVSGQTSNNKAALKSELEQESKELGVIKKELADEYSALNGRRDRLLIEGKIKMNSKETKVYNQKANELNQDTLKFKEKQQAYIKRVGAYNLKLEAAS